MRKVYTDKTKEELLPRTEFGPLQQIVVDLAYFSESIFGKIYMLVIIDRYSKLVCLIALGSQDEITIAEAIKTNWIYKFERH